VSRREILGFAAVACVACCLGPILGGLRAIAALGVVSTVFIAVAEFAIAATATRRSRTTGGRRLTPASPRA